MSSLLTLPGRKRILSGDINLGSATVKVALLGSGFTPSVAHEFASAFAGHELAGSGYVAGFGGAGRKTLASKTFTTDGASAIFSATIPAWTGINAGTARYLAILLERTSDADSPLVAVLDVGTAVTDGGSVTITTPASGLIRWKVA